MDRIEDSFDTASGQEGRLRPDALSTITELPRVVKNDQPTRLDLAALRKREDPVPDRFEQLKQKYRSVLGTLQKESAQLQNLNMGGNQLYVKVTAPSEASKNRIWDAIKRVDTNFADLEHDTEFRPTDQTYTAQADDTLSKINKYKKIVDVNKLGADQIKPVSLPTRRKYVLSQQASSRKPTDPKQYFLRHSLHTLPVHLDVRTSDFRHHFRSCARHHGRCD